MLWVRVVEDIISGWSLRAKWTVAPQLLTPGPIPGDEAGPARGYPVFNVESRLAVVSTREQ